MGKYVTLKDIAAETGLTMASVSRALHDLPEISEETKRQVWKVANELGYRPNVFASTLRTGKSRFIGLIIPKNTNPYHASIISEIIAVVVDNGYLPLIFNSLESKQLEAEAVSAMLTFRVAGILTVPVDLKNYLDLPIPVVTIARQFEDELLEKFDYIITDEHGIELSIEHLAKRFDKIYYISGPKTLRSAMVRRNAFEDAIKKVGLHYSDDLVIFSSSNDSAAAYESACKLFASAQKPYAIQCMSDHMAMGVIQALSEFNLKVPEDIAIVGYDDIAYCDYLAIPLSSIRLDQEIGKVAAEFMFRK